MPTPKTPEEAREHLIHCLDSVVIAGMLSYEAGDTEAAEMCDTCAEVIREATALHDAGDHQGAAMLVDSIETIITKALALLDKPN